MTRNGSGQGTTEHPQKVTLGTAVGVIVAILALIYSWHIDNKYLPLNQANVVLSEESIGVVNEEESDRIDFSFRNIGRFEARDVRFQIFVTALKPWTCKELMTNEGNPVLELFNATLVHPLQPETSATLGSLYMPYKSRAGRPLPSDQAATLLFRLNYFDTLRKVTTTKHFLFQHQLNTKSVRSLISDDFSAVKDCLLQFFETRDNRDDQKTLRFLSTN